MNRYKNGILGGTFDRFHAGHRHFLDTAMATCDYLTIGIATPALFSHKPLASKIEPYETRKKNVENYLNQHGFEDKFEIIPLKDIYGNALVEPNLDAILTTHKTLAHVEKINEERKKIGFAPLEIIFVEPLKDASGEIISSSKIRAEELRVS